MRKQRKVSVRMRFTLYFLSVKESHFVHRPRFSSATNFLSFSGLSANATRFTIFDQFFQMRLISYHFKLFSRQPRLLTISSNFPSATRSYLFEPIFTGAKRFIPFQAIFTTATATNSYQLSSFLREQYALTSSAIFTAGSNHLKPFLPMHHLGTIFSHFYDCDSFLQFLAIFTTATLFQPVLRLRVIFTIFSHFSDCESLSAIFMTATHSQHFQPFLNCDSFSAIFKLRLIFSHF